MEKYRYIGTGIIFAITMLNMAGYLSLSFITTTVNNLQINSLKHYPYQLNCWV